MGPVCMIRYRIFLEMLLLVLFYAIISSVSSTTELYEETSTISSAGSDGSSCIGTGDPTRTTDAIKRLSGDYLGSCLALLGKDRLQQQQALDIWNRLLEVYGGAPEFIPEYLLRHLGWIAMGIPASDMLNLTMTDVDTVAALGVFRNLSESQLSALAQAFREQWPAKDPEDWTDIDLVMFGHILCGFNESDILRMHADAYKMAALEGSLANLRGCNNESMEALAKLAVSSDAFGDPQFWEAVQNDWQPHLQVRAVGCILSGLAVDSLAVIPATAIAGLSLESVRCLPQRVMSALTSNQLSKLPSGTSEAKGGEHKDSDAPPIRPYTGQDEDYMAKNKSYPIVSNAYGFMAIFGLLIYGRRLFNNLHLCYFVNTFSC